VYLLKLHQAKIEFYHIYRKRYLIQNKEFHEDQTGFDAYLAYCPVVTGAPSPGGKAAGK
jgi:hypothetical protein